MKFVCLIILAVNDRLKRSLVATITYNGPHTNKDKIHLQKYTNNDKSAPSIQNHM